MRLFIFILGSMIFFSCNNSGGTGFSDEYLDELVKECIPPKKYSHDWDDILLQKKMKEVFNINLPIKIWFDEEGVDL